MPTKDMTGLRFGRLTVISPTEKRDRRGVVYWLCKCDCGNNAVVSRTNLRNGATQSCGCLRAEANAERARKMGLANRKHFGCMYCGSDKHYAKGCCENCYAKLKRGTL